MANPKKFMNAALAEQIRAWAASGWTHRRIAEEIDNIISPQQVGRIVRGESWGPNTVREDMTALTPISEDMAARAAESQRKLMERLANDVKEKSQQRESIKQWLNDEEKPK